MKKITSMLLLVAIFATMLSISAFAASASVLTITTDKTSVAAGETVLVTVEATGNFLNVASVSTSIAFDTDKFEIDTTTKEYNETVDDDFYVCFDADWVDSIMNDKKNSLGRLAAPMSAAGENPAGQLNVVFQKSTGLTTSNSNLTTDGSVVTTVAAIFTAKVDVATIDASCFSLVEGVCKIETASKELHTLTYNQIEASAPEFTPETVKGAVVEGDDANIVLEKDPATAYKNEYTNVAKFEATLGADVNYSEAGFIWVKDDKESANKFTVDASVIAGGGTFEYAVAMYAIPAGVDIDAIPYYVTAE